jgi:myo-inositol 2-dehydrogenase/D-chiro-inositol 1-dehydrogenase
LEQIRVGIIGAGPIVEKKHLPALAEVKEFSVVAACRRNAEALHQLADRFRIPTRYAHYRALLDDDQVDAVLIAAGPPAQTQIVIDAAAAGKPMLVEKPLAESTADAIAMCEAVKRANVYCQVGFNKRFYYGYQQARRVIDQGDLGRISGIAARFWFQSGRRDGLLHNGLHFLDLMEFFAGPVTDVFARRSMTTENGAAGDTLSISLSFAGGAVGSLLLSSLASWDYPNERVDIVGSNTSALSVDNGRQLRVFRRGEGRPAELYENTLSVHWWSGHEEQGFIPQLRFFARQIRDGAAAGDASPAAGAREGIASLALVEAVRRSITDGGPVAIPPIDSRLPATPGAAVPA